RATRPTAREYLARPRLPADPVADLHAAGRTRQSERPGRISGQVARSLVARLVEDRLLRATAAAHARAHVGQVLVKRALLIRREHRAHVGGLFLHQVATRAAVLAGGLHLRPVGRADRVDLLLLGVAQGDPLEERGHHPAAAITTAATVVVLSVSEPSEREQRGGYAKAQYGHETA